MSFQTPGHALPGAFLNTPAVASRFNAQQDPVRRLLFPPNSASAPSAAQPARPAPDGLAASGPSPFRSSTAGSNVASSEASLRNPQTPVPPEPPLARAATFVNSALARDEHYPELDSYCRREFSPRYLTARRIVTRNPNNENELLACSLLYAPPSK